MKNSATKIPRGQRGDMVASDRVNLPLRDWAREVDIKDSLAYEMSRKNRIPGQFRVGRFVRVHMPTFYAAVGIQDA